MPDRQGHPRAAGDGGAARVLGGAHVQIEQGVVERVARALVDAVQVVGVEAVPQQQQAARLEQQLARGPTAPALRPQQAQHGVRPRRQRRHARVEQRAVLVRQDALPGAVLVDEHVVRRRQAGHAPRHGGQPGGQRLGEHAARGGRPAPALHAAPRQLRPLGPRRRVHRGQQRALLRGADELRYVVRRRLELGTVPGPSELYRTSVE